MVGFGWKFIMTIKLEAISPLEGIGIIRTDHSLRLIRPPYLLHESSVLNEETLRDAIVRHGFSGSGIEFISWEDAITFLNEQVIVSRRSLGKAIPEHISGTEILNVAPPEVLNAYLDRIERELIPQSLFDDVEDFLVAFLASNEIRCHVEIGGRVANLLKVNKAARKQSENRVTELSQKDVRFPSLEKHGQLERSASWADLIRERGCVFA